MADVNPLRRSYYPSQTSEFLLIKLFTNWLFISIEPLLNIHSIGINLHIVVGIYVCLY